MAIAVVDNSSPTSGDLNDEAWDAYNATVAALLTQHSTAGAHGVMTATSIAVATITGVATFTATSNLDIGSYTFRCAGLIDDSLTSGRVPFASTNGLLADDADFTFSEDTLTVDKLALNSALTSSSDMVTLTPGGAIAAGATWRGIYINGASLDPSGANAAAEGIDVDLSGIATTNTPVIMGVRVAVPAGVGYEAFHSIGQIKLDSDESSLAAGETATGLDIIVAAVGAGGGIYHGIDVASAGSSSATLIALATHTGINVIRQNVGSFISPTKAWKYDDSGTSYTDVTTAFGSAGTDVTMFEDDDDAIFVGADAAFDEIEVILATVASVDIKPWFYYSKAATFTRFFPADDTEGFTQSGDIRFDASDLSDFAAQSVNSVSKFYIKIVRTRNNVVTDPIEDTIKTLAATEYSWDSSGYIVAAKLDGAAIGSVTPATGAFTAAGLTVGTATPSAAQWGYLGALAKNPLGVDAAARVLRGSYLLVENGTNVSTIKCTVASRFNGDTIAVTDNVAKGATTGNFTLDAAGEFLTVEAAGLTGNCVYAWVSGGYDTSGLTLLKEVIATGNDIRVRVMNTSGTNQDLTVVYDSTVGYFEITYVTDA